MIVKINNLRPGDKIKCSKFFERTVIKTEGFESCIKVQWRVVYLNRETNYIETLHSSNEFFNVIHRNYSKTDLKKIKLFSRNDVEYKSHCPFGCGCIWVVIVDKFTYHSSSAYGEIAIWNLCKDNHLDPFLVFKLYLTHFSTDADHLMKNWYKNATKNFRADKEYLSFVQTYTSCLANHVQKLRWSGKQK